MCFRNRTIKIILKIGKYCVQLESNVIFLSSSYKRRSLNVAASFPGEEIIVCDSFSRGFNRHQELLHSLWVTDPR